MVRIALVLLSLLLVVHGADGTYGAIRARTDVRMTCDDVARQGVRAGSLRLTGCEVDYLHAGYREAPADIWRRMFGNPQPASMRISELLFPVRATGADPNSPAALIVSTRDPHVLAIAERTLGSRATIDQEAFLVMMLQVVTAMRVSPEIAGAVRTPLDALRSRGTLNGMRTPLLNTAAILDLHERPSPVLPAIELTAGLLGLAVASVLRRKTTGGAREDLPPADRLDGIVSFPRLMLLKLPAHATPREIENAPPLGTQAEVRQRLAAVFPGLAFDPDGKAHLAAADHTVEIDIGSGEPVHTAVVQLKGDAARALASLLKETGWRAYAPRRGAFVGVADLRQRG